MENLQIRKIFKVKKAFSMITAIFVIVIMASITSLIMNVTGKTIKETTQQYQKEQAMLLARSYTEQAVLYALHYDRTINCITQINATFGDNSTAPLYTIQTNIQYAGNASQLPVTDCITIDRWADTGTTGFQATVSLIIDVYVTYKDLDDPSSLVLNGDRNITFHKRTLQKL